MYLNILRRAYNFNTYLSTSGLARDRANKAMLYRYAIEDLQSDEHIKRFILLGNGKLISLADWQNLYEIGTNNVGKFFSLRENKFNGSFIIAAPLIEVLDEFRQLLGKPVIVTSLFRTIAFQRSLQGTNNQAAGISPHCGGFAADIAGYGEADCQEKAKILQGILAKKDIRFYVSRQRNFLHIDVCPMFIGNDKPFVHLMTSIPQWANKGTW
jgi:hypothetical protein